MLFMHLRHKGTILIAKEEPIKRHKMTEWKSLTDDEKQPYFEEAKMLQQLHKNETFIPYLIVHTAKLERMLERI